MNKIIFCLIMTFVCHCTCLYPQVNRSFTERELKDGWSFKEYGTETSYPAEVPGTIHSDLLSNGTSSRLYQRLVKENPLFSNVNAYISGDVDPGLFLVTGHVMEGTSLEAAEAALWNELERMKNEPVGDYELEKVKNKFEANNVFGEINVLNKAMNLAYFEMLGDAALINDEVAQHNSVTRDEIQEVSRRIFRPENSSTLLYIADPEAPGTAAAE